MGSLQFLQLMGAFSKCRASLGNLFRNREIFTSYKTWQVADRMLATQKHFDLDTTVLQTCINDVVTSLIALISHKHWKPQCLCTLHVFWATMGQSDFNQISTSRFLFLLLTNLQKQSVQSAFWWDPWNPSKAFSQVNGLHCLALLSTSLFDSIFVCKFSGFRWPTHFCLWPTSHLARPIFWQCFCYQLAALNRGQHAAKCYSKWSRDTRLQQGSLEGVQRSLIGLLNFAPWCYKKTFSPDQSLINTHDLINHVDYCRSTEICIVY